jgi:SAM-dependent methyltransferase
VILRVVEADRTPAQVFDEFFVPSLLAPCARELVDAVPPRSGDRVLDVACGTGIVARTAAPLVGSQGRVVGVDLMPGMIALASVKAAPEGAPVEWLEGDALDLDLPDGSFDLVLPAGRPVLRRPGQGRGRDAPRPRPRRTRRDRRLAGTRAERVLP